MADNIYFTKTVQCDHAKFINRGNIERDDPNQEQPLKY